MRDVIKIFRVMIFGFPCRVPRLVQLRYRFINLILQLGKLIFRSRKEGASILCADLFQPYLNDYGLTL